MANVAFRADVELGLRPTQNSNGVEPSPTLPSTLLSPGVWSLDKFVDLIKSASNSSTMIGQLLVRRVELRKSKRLPFRHEYVLVFVESEGRIYVIRLDR